MIAAKILAAPMPIPNPNPKWEKRYRHERSQNFFPWVGNEEV